MKKIYWIIVLIVIITAALVVAFWPFKSQAPENHQMPAGQPVNEVSDAEQGCLDSGGSVTTASCCESMEDFPGNCAIGACGCAPEYSHLVKFCSCEEEKCFDGKRCVDENLFR